MLPAFPTYTHILPQILPSSPRPSCPPIQSCPQEFHDGSGTLQEENLETEAQEERVENGDSSGQERDPKDKDGSPAKEVRLSGLGGQEGPWLREGRLGAGGILQERHPFNPEFLQAWFPTQMS